MKLGEMRTHVDSVVKDLEGYIGKIDKRESNLQISHNYYDIKDIFLEDSSYDRIFKIAKDVYTSPANLTVFYSPLMEQISLADPAITSPSGFFIDRKRFDELKDRDVAYRKEFEKSHPIQPIPGMESLQAKPLPREIYIGKHALLDNLEDASLSSIEVHGVTAIWDLGSSIGYGLESFNHPTDLAFLMNKVRKSGEVVIISGKNLGKSPIVPNYSPENLFLATPTFYGQNPLEDLEKGIRKLVRGANMFELRFRRNSE